MDSLLDAATRFPVQILAIAVFLGHAALGTALAEPASYEPPRPRAENVMPAYPNTRGPWLEDEATVTLRMTIDRDGTVVAPEVVEGREPFATRALRAVRRWRYEPAREDGRPVAASWDVRMRFEQPRRTRDRFASYRHEAPASDAPAIPATAIGAVAASPR